VPVHAVFIDAVHAHNMLTHIVHAHVVNNAFYIRLNNYMPTATKAAQPVFCGSTVAYKFKFLVGISLKIYSSPPAGAIDPK
jgi:hypothetical protein